MPTEDASVFLDTCNSLMHGFSDIVLLCNKYGDLRQIPHNLDRIGSRCAVLIMVGVALARLGYDDEVIIADINRIRRLYEDNHQAGYEVAYQLVESRYHEAMRQPRPSRL